MAQLRTCTILATAVLFALVVQCACSTTSTRTTHPLVRLSQMSTVFRRTLVQSVMVGAAVGIGCNAGVAVAADGNDAIKFTVSLPADGSGWTASPDAALYLTARQDVGIFQAQIKNVKPPPVLSKRVSVTGGSEVFPVEIVVSGSSDLTPEGQDLKWATGKLPLVISARLDADGIAATRDPQDLIGRVVVKKVDGKWEDGKIDLQGRGVAGKFITNKK